MIPPSPKCFQTSLAKQTPRSGQGRRLATMSKELNSIFMWRSTIGMQFKVARAIASFGRAQIEVPL